MKKAEFLAAMNPFADFYEKVLNETQTRLWFDMFKTYPVSQFAKALADHIQSSDDSRFPALGIIHKRCQGWKPQ